MNLSLGDFVTTPPRNKIHHWWPTRRKGRRWERLSSTSDLLCRISEVPGCAGHCGCRCRVHKRWWDYRSNLEKSFSLFRTVELSIKMFSPPPFGLSLESEPLCVGRLSTQSNSLPIGRQSNIKFSHGLIIWCRTDFITTIHHQSNSTSHLKLFDSSGSLLYKGIPASEAGEPGQEGVWLLGWDRILLEALHHE